MRISLLIIKRTLNIVIILTIVFLVNGIIEHFLVQNKINEFKSRGVEYFYIANSNSYYYKVAKKHEYEDASRNVVDFDRKWLGSKTDIFITSRNPMRDDPNFSWIVAPLSKYFYIGHATINVTDSGSKVIEVFGNSSEPEDNVVAESNNIWYYSGEDTPNIVGLRIKNTTEEQRNKIVDYAKSKLGYLYNYSFLLNRNRSFYCTDLVSRAVASVGININYDHLATTGNDLIVSRNVYIIYYRELIYENGRPRYNIYFLGKE
ncbi:MAG: hypothetical protein M0R05_07225 [Bacilli bacterium]|nr:hypothetical protein [Bacilli bacterium]MDD4077310.1 YiiX/YebB-like N1pC/P60 family cysteine hydrolase [Bacilli bacterium]MDD4387815.1 YiiX/YebB-like N1pC/P60 family cysteine hydrolase [Bacilli bacterium]